MFKRFTLTTQLAIMAVAILCSVSALVLHLVGTAREQAAIARAVTVADVVQGVGAWAAQYSGIWVRGGGVARVGMFEEKEAVSVRAAPGASAEAEAVSEPLLLGPAFHSKSATLVQSELARFIKGAGGVAVKLTSDSHLNPINAPSEIEAQAIKQLRQDANASELTVVRNGSVHYVRKLIADQSCLACHGDPSTAPQQIRTVFGINNGFGYKVGEMAGVISVTSPISSALPTYPVWTDPVMVSMIAVLVVVIIATAIGLRSAIILPAQQLQRFARSAASASLDQQVPLPGVIASDASDSRNEIQGLGAAVKAMYQSMRILHRDSTAANADNVRSL